MITPFHIAAAIPIKLLFPKQFSLLWFSIVNVLIDIEVVYYFLTTGYPSHKFFHSILGVSSFDAAVAAGIEAAEDDA